MAELSTDIARAADLLGRGRLVAIPTETVYGLAGNAIDPAAVASIFHVKNRPTFDPIIVHVRGAADLDRYAREVPAAATLLAEKFWPGPLTLLLPRRTEVIPDIVTAGLDRVALRAPRHDITSTLLDRLSFPLAAPSANPFGYVSPTTPAHVQDQLGERIPMILDGGVCTMGIESTIIGWEHDRPVVYRYGALAIEQLEAVIGEIRSATSTARPEAAGQLKSHYSPRRPLVLGDIPRLLDAHPREKSFAVMSFSRDYHVDAQIILSPAGDLKEAAHRLFAALRALDTMPVDVIYGEVVPEEGLGRAINDRLRKAAAR